MLVMTPPWEATAWKQFPCCSLWPPTRKFFTHSRDCVVPPVNPPPHSAPPQITCAHSSTATTKITSFLWSGPEASERGCWGIWAEQWRPFRRCASGERRGPETQSIFGRGCLFVSVFNPSGTKRQGAGKRLRGKSKGKHWEQCKRGKSQCHWETITASVRHWGKNGVLFL